MKTIKETFRGKKIFGYQTVFAAYGKNLKNNYRLEVKILFTRRCFPIYQGSKRPIFRNLYVISALSLLINLAATPFMIVGVIVYVYFDGARNFVRDKAWYDNVREFTWMNILLVIILSIILIIK